MHIDFIYFIGFYFLNHREKVPSLKKCLRIFYKSFMITSHVSLKTKGTSNKAILSTEIHLFTAKDKK